MRGTVCFLSRSLFVAMAVIRNQIEGAMQTKQFGSFERLTCLDDNDTNFIATLNK